MADAINMTFKNGKVVKTKEVASGILLDFNTKATFYMLKFSM